MRACLAALALSLPTVASATGISPHAGYLLYCSGCHGTDGSGSVTGGIPAFEGSLPLLANDRDGRLYILHVPGVLSAGLSDAATAEVMNYVLGRWAPEATRFTTEEVASAHATPVPDVVVLRREIARRMSDTGTPLSTYPWP